MTTQDDFEITATHGRSTVEPLIVSLDVGTSSVRTLLFDACGHEVEGFGAQVPYQVATTPDGGVEVDADRLAEFAAQALSLIHGQMSAAGLQPAAVAFCAFWHSVLGVDGNHRPTTPIIHLFDTRSAAAAKELAKRIDPRGQHAHTGCVLHPSYVPAKLLWLSETRAEAFRATERWMSFGEYFFLKLFGRAVASTSMASGSGLWNQNQNDYDSGMLSVLPIDRSQLSPAEEMDEPLSDLRPEYRSQWPRFAGAQWYPALGDGACNNIGSGCHAPDRFALMVGTSGAMRAVQEASRIDIPEGLWCYRVDRRRFVLGGALSNGGLVFEWMKRALALPADDAEIERALAETAPGSHGLTVLPLFAGERSTGWRADARAAIAGMSMNTRPIDILRAGLEAVALRFRLIYDLMTAELGRSLSPASLPAGLDTIAANPSAPDSRSGEKPGGGAWAPRQVVASGGALLRSRAWTQMMADALGRPIVACLEKEASSRGAALLVLERLGAIRDVSELLARMGALFEPAEAHRQVYEGELRRQRRLYRQLFEEENGTD